MEYLLIQVIRDDGNGNPTEVERIYRFTSLLMEPQQGMNIVLENSEVFYIHYIRQDLKNKRIILYEYHDINYRQFFDADFLKTFMMAKIGLGWKRTPEYWKYIHN
jgi:hypothetical protein